MAPEVSILALAMVLDQLFGEPPAIIHPVVWMGSAIAQLEKYMPRGKVSQFGYGFLLTVGLVTVFSLACYILLNVLREWNTFAYVVVGAVLFKTTFALRELRSAALRVADGLKKAQLDKARADLRHLVSRDIDSLDEPLIVAATVESVAENVNDSLVAPFLYFLLLGVPGAMAYRAFNTLDAMVGYHGKHEYVGKFAARCDDVLNLVPARLSALLTVAASALLGDDARRAWSTMLRDHSLTASPNAGWTMSAMSGALGVQLEKVGFYRLGDAEAPLTLFKIVHAVNISYVTAMLAWALAIFVEVLLYVSPF